jgi:uncharacterized 2Fe-2S/4Fe-4S cluster protein (DUF4445 family)
MIQIKVITSEQIETVEINVGSSLLDILREQGFAVYAPCGGKGTCGKCRLIIPGEGNVISCNYYPLHDLEVILPERNEVNILVSQTEFLEDLPYQDHSSKHLSNRPYGVAIDLGTTTVVLYFLNLHSGQIEQIASFLNPQNIYGADVISRINYCQGYKDGLNKLQQSIVGSINAALDTFKMRKKMGLENFEKLVFAGNTTMLHILLGKDPLSIALAPFTPKFTGKQKVKGASTGFHIHEKAEVITLPCISAYVGADIVAGMAAIKTLNKNYLFLDIGTNGEIALIKGDEAYTCSTAAGPAFEGASLSCGMGAVSGAISSFSKPQKFQVIGNIAPGGICGSGIIDIVAYLLQNELMDETGLLRETFVIHPENKILVTQQDVREIQLAKSAIYSGIKILINMADLAFQEIDALFLAGGFGNYIDIQSAIRIGLLPDQLNNKIIPVGNSAGIGALQYLKSNIFGKKIDKILKRSHYIELSNRDDFTMEFALNMNFIKQEC